MHGPHAVGDGLWTRRPKPRAEHRQHQRRADPRRFVSAASRGQDDSKAPPPRVAHQQRRSAGAVTTAISVLPATSSAT